MGSPRVLRFLLVILSILLALPDLAMAQRGGRGGRGGGGARAGGNSPRNPNPRNDDDPDEPEEEDLGIGSLPSPERPAAHRLAFVEVTAEQAGAEGMTDETAFLGKLVRTRARQGFPTVLFLHAPSPGATAVETAVFGDERIVVASRYFTAVRVSLAPPFPADLARGLTAGKPCLIAVFHADGTEEKRFFGSGASAAVVLSAVGACVSKARGANLHAFVAKEQALLRDIEKQFTALDKLKAEIDKAAENASNSGARRRIDDLKLQVLETCRKIEDLKSREKAHVATAPKVE